MNIYTVRDNLKNTIAGKEVYLAKLKQNTSDMAWELSAQGELSDVAVRSTIEFLKINIDELKVILADVEVCCQQHNEMGWVINPERMGQ